MSSGRPLKRLQTACGTDGGWQSVSGASMRALSQRFFAGVRFLRAELSDTPKAVAFWRVALSVRLSALAIFATGSLRAMPLRARTSSFDHGRQAGDFLLCATALATFASPSTEFQPNGVDT